MSLASKTSQSFYVTTGGGTDEINAARKLALTSAFTADKGKGNLQLIDDNIWGPVIFNIQRMQDDLDEVRRYIVSTAETGRVANGVVYASSEYYIPITATDFLGLSDPRGGCAWGMEINGTWISHGRQTGFVEKLIPIGFKATGCIVYGDYDGSSDNTFRGYEGAINANTNTARGTSKAVGTASDFTTDGGSDIAGDGVKTCRIIVLINEARDTIFGGKIILETV